MPTPAYPYEASVEQIEAATDDYVDNFITGLRSFFELMPRGRGFVDFERFQSAYKVLREYTHSFSQIAVENILSAIRKDPLTLVVLRSILGVTPPELASLAQAYLGSDIDQGTARRLDKRARDGRDLLSHTQPRTQQHVRELIEVALKLLESGAPHVSEAVIHRLDKVDTAHGIDDLIRLAKEGLPYEVLLYERFLGRPFASHRDSVSEHVGEMLQGAVRSVLDSSRVPYHESAIAERFEDMDQAPDFLVPSASQPIAVIESKLAEDDGTARDKVTRIQHLGELRDQRERAGQPSFEVIACVDGRGFSIRREDVRKLLLSTRGKLFNASTVHEIIAHSSLASLTGSSQELQP